MDFFSLRAARFRFGDWRYLLSMVRSVSLFFCIFSDFHSPQRTLGPWALSRTLDLGIGKIHFASCLDKFRPVASQSQSRFFASALSAFFHNAVLLGMRALGSGKQLAPSTIDVTSHTSSLGIVRHCGLLACIWLLLLLLQSARPFEVNIRIAIRSLN